MALHEVLLSEVVHQCAWCGQVTDGEQQGGLYFEENKDVLRLFRLPRYSHVCCTECRKRSFDGRKRDRHMPPVKEGALLIGDYDDGLTYTKQSTR